jgi:hypothetical protein
MVLNWIQYKELNLDLEKSNIKTDSQYKHHYNLYGIKENRMTSIYDLYPDFNWELYRDNYNLDYHYTAKELYENHWLQYGQYENKCYNMKITLPLQTITFITPTIGRPTLVNTIKSVINQTCTNWKYIVVFDGVKIAPEFEELIKTDSRISSIIIKKTGTKNYAGRVRNKGIDRADSEWIGFVDDDDTISSNYVEYMNGHIYNNPKVEYIIYRMIQNNCIIPKNSIDFSCYDVGISFCYKLKLYKKGIKFEPGKIEDFTLLDKIRNHKHMIILSEYICYYVNHVL